MNETMLQTTTQITISDVEFMFMGTFALANARRLTIGEIAGVMKALPAEILRSNFIDRLRVLGLVSFVVLAGNVPGIPVTISERGIQIFIQERDRRIKAKQKKNVNRG